MKYGPSGADRIFSPLLLSIVLALCVVRLWLMELPSSFWVDEMATVFVVQHGAHDPSLAVAPQVPDSVYYWLPRAASTMFGQSETAYRIPSLLAAGLTLLLVARLARRLIDARAGWFAAFACLTMHEFNEHAVDARPYALGMMTAAAAVWLMVRWLDSARWIDGLSFALCAALLWPVHLAYWPFYFVLFVYTAMRVARKETALTPVHAAAILALVGLLDLPVALRALDLMRHAGSHVIQPVPSLHHLEWSLRWKLVAGAAVFAWILSRITDARHNGLRASRSDVWLAVLWWLVPPLALAGYSYVTGNSTFVARYFSLCLPGLALTTTFAVRPFFAEWVWNPAAAVIGIGALALLGQWNMLWPPHEHSDWRGAAALVNREAPGQSVPVICTSPFIEGESPNWTPAYPLPGFLYAHLSVYRVAGHILLFPFQRSAASEQYAAALLPEALTAPGKFVIYGGAGNVRDWRNWFAQRAELRGWSNRLIPFGDVYVVIFTRTAAA